LNFQIDSLNKLEDLKFQTAAKQRKTPRPQKRLQKPPKPLKKHQEQHKVQEVFVEDSFVVVKEEAAERLNLVEETSYCRCCFKAMNFFESQNMITEATLKTFENIIQVPMEISPIASSFCESCHESINSFSQFKNLAILKQQKFIELSNNGGDINDIHQMKVLPETVVKDEETEEKSVVKEEVVGWAEPCDDLLEERFASDQEHLNDQEDSNDRDESSDPDYKCNLQLRKSRPSKLPTTSKKDPAKREKCKQCGVKPHDMKKHLLSFHAIKCHRCKFKATDLHEMVDHIQVKHENDQLEPQNCPECGKMVRNSLKKHIEAVHRKIRKFFCDICGFSGYERAYLNNHMRQVHLARSIKCPHCDFATITKFRLSLHMQTHSEKDRRFKCEECNRCFCNSNYLKVHIDRKHKKVKEARCDICNKDFYSKSDYK
jgi:hypothetical protein